MMEEVVVATGTTRRAKLQSDRYHQQTNIRMPFLPPNQQCRSTQGKTTTHYNDQFTFLPNDNVAASVKQ